MSVLYAKQTTETTKNTIKSKGCSLQGSLTKGNYSNQFSKLVGHEKEEQRVNRSH